MQILAKCREIAGGQHRHLVGELSERGVDDVDLTVISKWRNFEKYRKVPKPDHVDALVSLIESVITEDSGEVRMLGQELRTVCMQLRLLVANDSEPTLDSVLSDASSRIDNLYNSHPHPTLNTEIIRLLRQSMLGDFANVLHDPARLVFNLRYTIRVSGTTHRWYVETEIEADRVFFGKKSVFMSFCSTGEALDHEYRAQSDGCIAREILNVDGIEDYEAWMSRALKYDCSLRVDGSPLRSNGDERVFKEGPGYVLRRYFDVSSTDLHKKLTPTTLKLRFDLSPHIDQFPIHFNSYYCVGTTRIFFYVSHEDYEPVITRSVFLPSAQSAPFKNLSDSPNAVELETSRSTVLAPGSGVLFRWSAS